MTQPLPTLVAAMWIGWAAYWMISASRTKRNQRRDSALSQLAYTMPLWLAGVLVLSRAVPVPALYARFVAELWWIGGPGAALAVLGFAFAVWARVHLGANWSSVVTVKRDHALILSGPYRLVRHPIYTGLLLALLGTAFVLGEWRDLAAPALVLAAFWYKLRVEERWMMETFGPAYAEYRGRVPALIPFLL